MGDKAKTSTEILKPLLIIFLPLITAIITANYQYVITRWEDSDKNYRAIVSDLTSKDKDKRHSAAASVGTYVKTGDRYFNETIDILTNRLSSESNHNVRNSMIGSLTKIKDEPEYRQVINRLLAIGRNNFIQDYQMKLEVDNSKAEFDDAMTAFKQAEQDFGTSEKKSDQFILSNLAEQTRLKQSEFQALQSDYDELKANIPMVSNMIAIFLSEGKGKEITGLDFFRSNMYNIVATDLVLNQTKIKWTTFSSSTLSDSQFIASTIARTYFSNSDMKNAQFNKSLISTSLFNDSTLINASFSDSTLIDVFFIGADLAGANFSNAKGLQPEFFFQTNNLAQAKFDEPGFIERVDKVSHEDFVSFVNNSSLNSDMKTYLIQ